MQCGRAGVRACVKASNRGAEAVFLRGGEIWVVVGMGWIAVIVR